MASQRFAQREKAASVRARSAALRERSGDLRASAAEESLRAVRSLQTRDGPTLGERDGGFWFRLPRLPIVLGLVRHELGRWLEREGVTPEESAEVVLACSEACANAMEHPQATERAAFEVDVRLRRGVLELAVRDYGSWDPDEDAEGDARGRGLDMIRSLMDDVSIVKSREGTEVAMRRRLGERG
jgi:anti-sigma regulatory factor (Ser/Thr protein kinase)